MDVSNSGEELELLKVKVWLRTKHLTVVVRIKNVDTSFYYFWSRLSQSSATLIYGIKQSEDPPLSP